MNIDSFDTMVSFKEKAILLFEFQKENNSVYGAFCKALGINQIREVSEIPLLPIQAFKEKELRTTNNEHPTSELYFESSGTSGMQRSRHYLADPEMYKQSILNGINEFYELDEFIMLAYTPGYNDNPYSSLVWMLNVLIEHDKSGLSRFLEVGKPLDLNLLEKINSIGKRVMLFGAAFGLLDLVEMGSSKLPSDSIIMETGGMKTHRREVSKEDLHERLANGFGLSKESIHSEYGMTELLSQAYSTGTQWLNAVPWMKVTVRNPKNPMEEMPSGEEGLIGVIDLANIYSCSFILTGDKGVQNEKGEFKVLGRWNPQNLRGCNFLIDQD